MDVSFYSSLERHSWSFPDWDMKPEHSSIPSPSCIPKGTPAARFSKDTSGTHFCTKHSSPRTAAGILPVSVHTARPPLNFWWVPRLHNTSEIVASLLELISRLLKLFLSVVSISFGFSHAFSFHSFLFFLLYQQADQTLASAGFSFPQPSHKPKGNTSTTFGSGTDPPLHLCLFRQISI